MIRDILGFNTRIFFFSRVLTLIFRFSRAIKKGKYSNKMWCDASFYIIKTIEGCGGQINIEGMDNISLVPVPITADEIVNLNNSLKLVPKGPFANNAAAIAGGCVVGELYYVNAATDPQPIYIVH